MDKDKASKDDVVFEENASELSTITQQERQEIIKKAGKTTLLKICAQNINHVKRNTDTIVECVSYGFFGQTWQSFSKGEYVNAVLYFLLTIIMYFLKKRVPEGNITTFLKKDANDLIDDVRKTFLR